MRRVSAPIAPERVGGPRPRTAREGALDPWGGAAEMSLHLHCPLCGELLAEDQSMVITSTREGTRQETFDLACRCGTRLRLQLPPERWSPPRRRRRGRGHAKPR